MFTLDSAEDIVRALGSIGEPHELCKNYRSGYPHEECEYDKESLHAAWQKKAAMWAEFGQHPLAVRWLIRDFLGIAEARDAIDAMAPFIDEEYLKEVQEDLLLRTLESFFDFLDREDVSNARFLMHMWRLLGLRCRTMEDMLPFASRFVASADDLQHSD